LFLNTAAAVPVIFASGKKKGKIDEKQREVFMLIGKREREKEMDSPRILDFGMIWME